MQRVKVVNNWFRQRQQQQVYRAMSRSSRTAVVQNRWKRGSVSHRQQIDIVLVLQTSSTKKPDAWFLIGSSAVMIMHHTHAHTHTRTQSRWKLTTTSEWKCSSSNRDQHTRLIIKESKEIQSQPKKRKRRLFQIPKTLRLEWRDWIHYFIGGKFEKQRKIKNLKSWPFTNIETSLSSHSVTGWRHRRAWPDNHRRWEGRRNSIEIPTRSSLLQTETKYTICV